MGACCDENIKLLIINLARRPVCVLAERGTWLKVLILGTSGVHHTLVAANMILSRFQDDFTGIDRYCDVQLDRRGFPIYVGSDEEGRHIYTLGAGKEIETARKALEGLFEVFSDESRYFLITEVRIKGEIWIRLASALARVPLGNWLNRLISDLVLKRQIPLIRAQAEKIQQQMEDLMRMDYRRLRMGTG
jgi:hypothetical protein